MSNPILDYAGGTSSTVGGVAVVPTNALTTDESGTLALGSGVSTGSVAFGTAKTSSAYYFEYFYVENVTDANPLQITPWDVAKRTTGFDFALNGQTDTANYVLKWRAKL